MKNSKAIVQKPVIDCIKSFLSVCDLALDESIYLETGLNEGDSVQLALDLNFKKIISIEIDKDAVDKANQRFKNEIIDSRVLLIQGDSQKKIIEIFDQNINIIYLDAHGNSEISNDITFAPLENEIKFLVDRVNEKQIIIIDDFLKVKNSFLFAHRHKSWKSKLPYKRFKEIISNKGLNTFEIFYNGTSNLLLTKNKNFKIGKILFLRNLINRFLCIKFYYKKNYFSFMFKKLIIFLLPDKVYNILKRMLRRS